MNNNEMTQPGSSSSSYTLKGEILPTNEAALNFRLEPVLSNDPYSNTNPNLTMLSINFVGQNQSLLRQRLPNNRVVSHDPRKFLHISFSNLSFKYDDDRQKYVRRVEEILTKGVEIEGIRYIFCGFSQEQLQSQSCFMYAAENMDIVTAMLNSFGNFSQNNGDSVGKHARTIGHLFSETKVALQLNPEDVAQIPDIIRHGQNFTNSCGLIDSGLAKVISNKFYMERPKNERNGQCPGRPLRNSVFRFCHEGKTGLLVVAELRHLDIHVELEEQPIPTRPISVFEGQELTNSFRRMDISGAGAFSGEAPKIQRQQPKVIFRNSMQKFVQSPTLSSELCILDRSEPSLCGKLNAEFISILSTLGIPNEVFLKKQTEYFNSVRYAMRSLENVQKFVKHCGRYDLLTQLKNLRHLWNAPSWVKLQINNLRKDELLAIRDKDFQNVQILIPKSRNIFGICDFSGKLGVGQCLINVTIDMVTKNIIGRIIVGRNPCLNPGDIRQFDAVDAKYFPELARLTDCIVFSTHGAIPPATCVSGGGLDSGKFWVCWDKDLMNFQRTVPPLNYSNLPPILTPDRNEITQMDLIKYFSNYTSTLQQIKNLYWAWIRVNSRDRAFSPECVHLNELYTRAMLGEEMMIPERLKNPPKYYDKSNPFILDLLIKNIRNLSENKIDLSPDELPEPPTLLTEQGSSQNSHRFTRNGPNCDARGNGYHRILPSVSAITPTSGSPNLRFHHVAIGGPNTGTITLSPNEHFPDTWTPPFRPMNNNCSIIGNFPSPHLRFNNLHHGNFLRRASPNQYTANMRPLMQRTSTAPFASSAPAPQLSHNPNGHGDSYFQHEHSRS